MEYVLKVNVLLAVFYGFYRLLYGGDTFFGCRRAALLLLYAAAVAIPAVDMGGWVAGSAPLANLPESYREVVLPAVGVGTQEGGSGWLQLLGQVYAAVAGLLVLRMAWQVGGILKLKRRLPVALLSAVGPLPIGNRWDNGEAPAADREGTRVYRLNDESSPFSFFRWIFVNPEAHTHEQLREILAHERAHAGQWHSVDVVLAELVCALCWPNPFAWLLRREVRLNLEFLADDYVLAQGAGRKAYQYHLLHQAHGKPRAGVGNHFHVLPLQLRIRMMNKQRTHRWQLSKYVLLAPVVVAALAACNLRAPRPKGEAPAAPKEKEPLVISYQTDSRHGVPGSLSGQHGKVYDVVEQMPTFPGGPQRLMNYLQENCHYPQQALEKGVQGRVVVSFVVSADGAIEDPRVVKSVDPLLDAEALRLVSTMPKWEPGRIAKKPVRVRYHVPVAFRLS